MYLILLGVLSLVVAGTVAWPISRWRRRRAVADPRPGRFTDHCTTSKMGLVDHFKGSIAKGPGTAEPLCTVIGRSYLIGVEANQLGPVLHGASLLG